MSADRELTRFGRPSGKQLAAAEAGRTCAEDGCDTVLSRYNKTQKCSLHEATPVPPSRRSK
jgi:hypothetical protein